MRVIGHRITVWTEDELVERCVAVDVDFDREHRAFLVARTSERDRARFGETVRILMSTIEQVEVHT